MGTLFSVLGGPAVALPCGFSDSGLPMGFQVGGRPFDDATVLQVAHAYELAAGWHRRRPALQRGAPRIAIDLDAAHHEAPPALAPEMRTMVRALVAHAGLSLDTGQLARIERTAPYAVEFTRRLRRDLPWQAEQAAVFRHDRPQDGKEAT
jgi:aspartyl-tRNA(Asn)/glutamyl-tRNA(Gln) amidotransferase subunit A